MQRNLQRDSYRKRRPCSAQLRNFDFRIPNLRIPMPTVAALLCALLMLFAGAAQARAIASETVADVRGAMGVGAPR